MLPGRGQHATLDRRMCWRRASVLTAFLSNGTVQCGRLKFLRYRMAEPTHWTAETGAAGLQEARHGPAHPIGICFRGRDRLRMGDVRRSRQFAGTELLALRPALRRGGAG